MEWGEYTPEELAALMKTEDMKYADYPADRGFFEDTGGLSEGMREEGFSHIGEMFQEEYGNLLDTSKRDDGKVFLQAI